MTDPRYPASVPDSSRTFLTSTGLKGDQGDPAIYAFPAVPVVPIPCESDGSSPVYTSATSQILIMQGGNLLTGWTLAYVSGSNCTGSVNNGVEPRTATIAAVTAASGYAEFTATKAATTLRFRLYFAKVYKGEKGDTGDTGAAGPAGDPGPAGAAGADGTGLVVVHKTITVDSGETVTKEDYGDGNLQINYSSAHGLTLGEYVWVLQAGVYDGGYEILEVVDEDSLKLDVAYVATAGTVTAFDMKHLRDVANGTTQVVAFDNIIPHGSKILEWQLLQIDDNVGNMNPLTVTIGRVAYGNVEASDYEYLQGEIFDGEGVLKFRDRRATIPMNISGTKHDIFIQITPSGGDQWNAELLTLEMEFFIAYINYAPTWAP